MLRFTDILINLIIFLITIVISFVISVTCIYPYLAIIPIIICLIISGILKRNKKISKYVKSDFAKLGYEILHERPVKLFENDFEVHFSYFADNGLVYIVNYSRVFKVKTEMGQLYELNTEITKGWDLKNSILIKTKKRLDSL